MWRLIIRSMCSQPKPVNTPIPVFGVEGRYVSALYSAAIKKKEIDEVEKHIRSLEKELSKPKIIDFLETSMISPKDKAKLLKGVGETTGMPSTAVNFLVVVAENGRLKSLKRIVKMFLAVMVAHRKEALCEVITAKPLDESSRTALMDALKKFVKGKNIQLTEKVDPEILGGVIVGVEDKHIDMSIARKMQMYTDIINQAV